MRGWKTILYSGVCDLYVTNMPAAFSQQRGFCKKMCQKKAIPQIFCMGYSEEVIAYKLPSIIRFLSDAKQQEGKKRKGWFHFSKTNVLYLNKKQKLEVYMSLLVLVTIIWENVNCGQ